MMRTNWVITTSGTGLWSDAHLPVRVISLDLAYTDEDWCFGELRAEFDPASWDCEVHGLIYTDPGFLRGLRHYLAEHGLPGDDVNYSEQGMQGDDYVSFDVGEQFISAFTDRVMPRKLA